MVPPVRPRSSLSTDEHHRVKDIHLGRSRRKQPSNALLTLAGFCVFLFVLCAFLLGALVYVGRQIAVENAMKEAALATRRVGVNLTDTDGRFAYAIPSGDVAYDDQLLLSTKPILRYRSSEQSDPIANNSSEFPTEIPIYSSDKISGAMARSKILNQLSFRLPHEVQPKHYRLRLQSELKAKTFIGNVTIRLKVLKPIGFIAVHSKMLTVTTQEVLQVSEAGDKLANVTPSLTFEHPELEYWITEFEKPLEIGEYTLRLQFNGSLTDRIVGFYQSSYFDKQTNETRWIATSKFEPTFARQAFPCFDEPDMKATFEVTVVFPSGGGYHALSNMNVDTETVVGDNSEVTFAESVPMSTYLVCFIVSDFANRSRVVRGSLENAKDFEMRVFSTAAQVNKVQYALDTGAAITEYYIKYFNIPYPLPKLDMAAIPDFGSGAMEHWGLITYRETALLYDEANSSSANKQRVATVVAHELAHMWFGNLVTMKWWNDLWLNEGFASYMEYKGVDAVHPDWKMLDQFLVEDLHVVMKLDATLASHPIVNAVESPSQIAEHFDAVTYAKGASIIRMLEDLVGAEKFRNATQKYLENFIFANAETDDFLTEIEQQDFDFDIKLILKTWTEQTGFPVVEVKQNGTSFKLTQRRFFSNPEDYIDFHDESTFNYRWSIPITYFSSANGEVHRAIFNHNDQELIVDLAEPVDWVKFNKDQKGYYRVNYPEQMWQTLISSLISSPNSFSVSDRAHLLSDAFALADASQLDYSIALDLSKYLEQERDYVPWKVGASRLKAIRSLLYSTDLHRDFELYVRKLLNVYQASGSSTSSGDHLQNRLRVDILRTACKFGEPGALQAARSRFEMWLRQPEVRPSPDLRSVVYYYGMQTAGSEQTWDQVWKLFVAETDAQEKLKLMQALAAIKEPWILQRYIKWAWDEKNVRGQDYFTCLRYISKNPIGQNLVWDYVRENWPRMSKRFGSNDVHLGRLMPGITAGFTTQTKLEEMQTFFAKYAGTAGRKQALETVKYNIRWLDQNLAKVGSWLSKQKSESTNSKLV